MNMYLHELKSYRKSTIIWTASLVLITIVFLSMFPSISNDAAQFKKILEGFPEPVRKALGISIDNITSLIGFYSYMFLYILLAGSIQAMNLGTSVLSKEMREKTADFLLTKPVTRTQIVTAKLLAVVTSLVISNIVFVAGATVMANSVAKEAFDIKLFLLISFTAILVELMFMALGMLVSVLVAKIKSVLPLSLSVVFAFFILSMFGSVIGEKAIRYLTPFKYYEPAYIIKHATYEASFVWLEVAFIIIAIIASYVIYLKKDIHAV